MNILVIPYLDISMELKSKDLELLLRNQLPNLSHLTLLEHEVPFQDGLLFRMLERFQNSLQTLKLKALKGLQSKGGDKPHTLFAISAHGKIEQDGDYLHRM